MPSLKTIFNVIGKSVPRLIVVTLLVVAQPVWSTPPMVEVMHWWNRGGESRAMQVLIDEFELRGGTWRNVAGENSIVVLNQAVSRMARGYAPTFVQWNSAWEVAQIRNLGLLNSVDQQLSQYLRESLIDNVLDMVTVDNEIVAVPVSVHSENWLWYKTTWDKSRKTPYFEDWNGFLKYASTAMSHEKAMLAVGTDPWQRRILFNNILLGVAGQNLYERIYSALDATAVTSREFEEAVGVFRSLSDYSESFGDGRWDQQIAAVASGKAYAVSMGDRAKGEFKNLGLRLGRDYQCMPAPGTKDNLILAIDVFALGSVDSAAEKNGQQLFVEVVTDPDVSETFSYIKGSLPPLREIDTEALDVCNQRAYTTLKKKGRAIRPYASIGDRAFQAGIDRLIDTLWSGEIEASAWITRFSDVLNAEHEKRKGSDQMSLSAARQ